MIKRIRYFLSFEILLNVIKGNKGEREEEGEVGEQGNKGVKGNRGEKGNNGSRGTRSYTELKIFCSWLLEVFRSVGHL